MKADDKKKDLSYPYGVVAGAGYDTDKMTPKEVVEKFKELSASETKEKLQKELPKKETVVKINMQADVQKQLDAATSPKERQKIAFRYIMDNLCGKYSTLDGREVTISSIGADKITHRDIAIKLRVSPELAKLVQAGQFENIVEATKENGQPHRLFSHFAYYKVLFQIGDDQYIGRLNIGIRKNGSSTLYDLNPFNKL